MPRTTSHPLPKSAHFPALLLLAALLFTCFTGCHSPTLVRPDLTAASWTKRSGQFAWTAKRSGKEIVADVNVWTSPAGGCWLEAHKSGLPFLTVQLTAEAWRIDSPATGRTHAGRGEPPRSIGWLQLARCLAGKTPSAQWTWRVQGEEVSLANTRTGERFEGFLSR